MPTHEITLDIKKRKGRVPPQVVVRVGDIATQTINAQITNDGAAYNSSLSSVRLDILHEDGTWARCTASKSGNKVTCTLPNAAVSSHGTCRLAHFVFYSGSTKAESTEGFELMILRNVDVSDATEEAESYDDILTKLWEKWDAYERQAEANESARVSAENTRKANEATRQTQEGGRVEAEKKRVSEFATLRTNAEKATEGANDAASAAQGAANNANAAANYASTVADNLSQSVVGDEEVAEMRGQIDKLCSMLADAQDEFVYMDGTIYAPKSKAAISGSTVTLASSCTANGATINLA